MIDLHIHTNHSDGTDTVKELLRKAEQKKLEIISITDHDEIGAYYELESNFNLRNLYSGKIITGSELKTFYNDVSIEVLAYGIDYKNFRIHKVDTQNVQKEILKHMTSVARKLEFKFDEKNLYIEENNPSKHYASFVLASELLKYNENKKIIKDIGEFSEETFFRIHQTNNESPFYFDETSTLIGINELIFRIHEAGGLAFLAHGYIYPFKNNEIEEILANTKIDGMECIYPLFSEKERKKAYNLCKKYNKYMSGGTDYHAKNKPLIELGTGINNNVSIEKEFVQGWIDKVRSI